MPLKKSLPIKLTEKKCRNKHWLYFITYLVLVLIIIFSGLKLALLNYQHTRLIDKSTYQVIFLDNGESYFGQLENIGFKNYRLTNVYYLKYATTQQEQITALQSTDNSANNYELKLIHLGDQEFYKPYSEMIINKDKIIYWENLQPDSEVMKFIESNTQ